MGFMSNLTKFREDKCLQLEYSLATGRTIQNLMKRTRDLHGNTQFNSFLQSTTASSSPIDWLEQDEFLEMRISALKYATKEIACLESSIGMPYQDIVSKLKFKHSSTPMKSIFEMAGDSEWGEVEKSKVIPLLKEFDWWVGILERYVIFGCEINSAQDLSEYLEKPLLKSFTTLDEVSLVESANWDLDERVFDNIVKQLQERDKEFVSEWLTGATAFNHFNAYTNREYSSLYSWLYLSLCSEARQYKSNLWATHKQWLRLGFELKDGAQPAPVVHYFKAPQKNEEVLPDENVTRSDFGKKVSIVYNADEVIGFEGKSYSDAKVTELLIIEQRLKDLDVSIFESFGDAYYDPVSDCIVMPKKESFKAKDATQDYYATLLHELVHWTGHKSRCNRKIGASQSSEYALEELVAEIGSSFLCSRFGLRRNVRMRSIDYINSWLSQFDGKESVAKLETAARLANRASNYIYTPKRDLSE
ncbi:DUF1738 domain-containing protein [Vibrio rotiferianus]|nr:DUF1738 domain-containing protein [Vibrio rotiferianus]TMX64545.1 hypothetical protein DA097_12520 [Vibrio rotiferianus]